VAKKASKKPVSKKAVKAAAKKKPASKPSRLPAVRSTSRKVQKAARTPAPKLAPSTKGKGPASTTPPANAFNNRPIPTPVTTDGKPKKNQVGFGHKELEHYRELLLAKRRELVGDMSQMEREALRSAGGNLSNLPLHMADMGTDNYEQEFTLGLVEKDRVLLREINQALAKLQDGTFGICEGTGKPIGKPRLEAQPWARFSIEYARQQERGFRRNL
jgi:RNA polymerase-binding protein DksA